MAKTMFEDFCVYAGRPEPEVAHDRFDRARYEPRTWHVTSARPSGTVTFLFTDIEGSTRLWDDREDAMAVALARHDEIVRAAIEAHHGYVFATGGDGFCSAFQRADDAVAAAVEAQRALNVEPWAAGVTLHVRMGLHTGVAQERDGDYFGSPVNRAARIMSAAHGGQILMAASTASLVDGIESVDLGEHHLRDVSQPQRVFQVRAEGLQAEFPPLHASDPVSGDPAVQVTTFAGHAVQVAARLVSQLSEGVWLVELAAAPDAVASLLGVTPREGVSTLDRVAHVSPGRPLTVVLGQL